jgi:hypothetical protein
VSMTELRNKRRNLIVCLIDTNLEDLDRPRVLSALNDWFQAYKTWEGADRFLDACADGRMLIRQSKETGQVPDSVVAGLGMRGKHQPVNASSTTYKDYRSNVGLDGFKARMNPGSFKPTGPYDTGTYKETRGKYALGLHDLSGSLFNPSKPTVSEQCRWKDDGKGGGKFADWLLLFTPLAPEADVRLYNLMKTTADTHQKGGGKFAEAVARVSKRMTRITYAQETDMGAGFVSIGHKGEGADQLPRFRYGAGDVQSETVGSTTVVKHVPGISEVRKKKALNYMGLLTLQDQRGSTSNEVIVKVRQHEGDRFPIVAQWDANLKGFACLPDETSSGYIAGGFIPDAWKRVQEL